MKECRCRCRLRYLLYICELCGWGEWQPVFLSYPLHSLLRLKALVYDAHTRSGWPFIASRGGPLSFLCHPPALLNLDLLLKGGGPSVPLSPGTRDSKAQRRISRGHACENWNLKPHRCMYCLRRNVCARFRNDLAESRN